MPSVTIKESYKEFDQNNVAYVPTTGVRKVFETPLVQASEETLKGYGHIVESPETYPIEIVQWPAQGWRPVDENSGNQGGVTEGVFEFWWKGDTLYARNNAVGDSYLFAWSQWPEKATTEGRGQPREKALIWRANYHPDGGQLFYPTDGQSFVIPLALPGDDVTPDKFVAFRSDGKHGLYIHPGVWHGAVVPIDDQTRLLDRQGRVHARISVDFVKEFGGYLSVPLNPIGPSPGGEK
jgi:ureidoglycolate lyase